MTKPRLYRRAVFDLKHKSLYETLPIGALLAMIGGFLEAYTYLFRGGVFCNAQTGNIVLMVINLVQGNFMNALYYPIPILSFMAGIMICMYMSDKFPHESQVQWEHILLIAEIILFFITGFMPKGFDALPNIMISFICSMQYNTFSHGGGVPSSTVFCTNNLRQLSKNLYLSFSKGDKRALISANRYFAVIAAFAAGIAAGAYTTSIFGAKSVWLCSLLSLAALIITTVPASKK